MSNGSVGNGPGTSTIKLDELGALRKGWVFAGAIHFIARDTWMLQRSAQVTLKE